MTVWRLLIDGKQDGAYNMAVDEVMAESCAKEGIPPTLRFYCWQSPTLSIGYFQKIRESNLLARCREADIAVVRRPTGGRAILHHREITYSVAGRTDDPLFPKGITGTYGVIAEGFLSSLSRLGITAEIVDSNPAVNPEEKKDPRSLPVNCFSHPYGHEIAVRGKKLIGSAQRRWRGYFLQHGSILLAPDPLFDRFLTIDPSDTRDRPHTTLEELMGKTV
ncbi:MAG: lipoate--protein ligase family protein, partial [Nitrospirae bacterium]|nr:lipoate--protein ligase family protein [Nitrospirota bacterium]